MEEGLGGLGAIGMPASGSKDIQQGMWMYCDRARSVIRKATAQLNV